MNKTNFKIIFIDIDATLVDDEKKISAATIAVLKRLKENGVYVVLTSGKAYKSVEEFAVKCFATPYLIASNGAIVRDFEKNINIFSQAIDKAVACEILRIAKEQELYAIINIDGDYVVDEIQYNLDPKKLKEFSIITSLTDFLEIQNDPVLCFTIYSSNPQKLANFRETLLSLPGLNVLPIQRSTTFRGGGGKDDVPYYVDIMAGGVHKAEAIKTLLKHLKIDISSTIGIGDGLNDLEMFEVVNYKIAMDNAEPEIKAMADMITTSNNESGVAKALNKIFFASIK